MTEGSQSNRRRNLMVLSALALLFLLVLPGVYPRDEGYITLNVEIPPTFKESVPGYFIVALVDVYLYRHEGKADVVLACSITDGKGKVVSIKTKTAAVETHLSDIQKIEVPADIAPGKYAFMCEASLEGGKSLKASDDFTVIGAQQPPAANYDRYTTYMMLLISLLVIFVIYLIYKLIKMEERRRTHG